MSATSIVAICAAASAQAQQQGNAIALPEVVVQTTPVPGAVGIQADKVPALLSTTTAKDFSDRKSPSVTDAITQHVPGAVALNLDGSDLSPDLFYRGFNVSRLTGRPNGLAVYQNGVRINEAFGDGVNLDLVPPIAVDHADIYTNNPIFGLNALGGALAFTMKNGFNFHGGDATILGGSYGRVNGFLEYGKEVGNWSFYGAVDGYRDGGYRLFGAQNAQRAYADLGYRTQDSEIHGIASFGRSLLGVQGVTPQVLVDQQYNSVFTTPQTTNNQAGIGQLTGRFEVAPHWTVNSNFYVRQFDQFRVDGNDAELEDCGGALAGTACLSEEDAPEGATRRQRQFVSNGQAVPYLGEDFPYGTTARSSTHTTTFGTQQQAVNRDKLFGHDNYFVVGASVDHSNTNFSSGTTLSRLNSSFESIENGFPGAGTLLQTRGQLGLAPVYARSVATYYGLFALDTFNLTDRLAVTGGGRYNIAKIVLADYTGQNADLNTSEAYQRFNPVIGATYEFNPGLTVYGGYSEANRAPTPLENSCSNPDRPCLLETALVADPPLAQVISRTVEAGARGIVAMPYVGGLLSYKAGYFRTGNTNDIIQLPSTISGQGYFANVPGSLRTGIEAGGIYNIGPLSLYANYAFVDATYQFNGTIASPNNPFANDDGNIRVRRGNRIPGIPAHLGKIGFDYALTPRFTIGMDTLLVGSQFYAGDDSNQNAPLPFYSVLNARASYQVTRTVQVFGLINNFTNNRYATFGTFFEPDTSGTLVSPTLAANANSANPNVRSVTVAQPLSVYGGVKVLF